jgi:hypothetical protein
MRLLRGRFSQYPDPGGGHMSFAIWSLAAQNVSLYPFCPWRDKCPLIHLAPGGIMTRPKKSLQI